MSTERGVYAEGCTYTPHCKKSTGVEIDLVKNPSQTTTCHPPGTREVEFFSLAYTPYTLYTPQEIR